MVIELETGGNFNLKFGVRTSLFELGCHIVCILSSPILFQVWNEFYAPNALFAPCSHTWVYTVDIRSSQLWKIARYQFMFKLVLKISWELI